MSQVETSWSAVMEQELELYVKVAERKQVTPLPDLREPEDSDERIALHRALKSALEAGFRDCDEALLKKHPKAQLPTPSWQARNTWSGDEHYGKHLWTRYMDGWKARLFDWREEQTAWPSRNSEQWDWIVATRKSQKTLGY